MSAAQWISKAWGVVGYRPGTSNIDPQFEKTYVPMTLPGDRVWQGVQKWSFAGENLLQNKGENFEPLSSSVRNPYLTSRVQTERIYKTAPNNTTQPGPTLFAELFQFLRGPR